MYFVELPDIGQQKLSFYLSVEEYLARHIQKDPLFFYWQVEPTVIFGRNQNMESEVNVEYCKNNGIQLFRRKSGGGCVYADLDNLMLCYVAKGNDVQLTYSNFITLILGALKRMGFDAKSTGRNDITIDGKKVSGSAFYHIPEQNRNIVHSTMLYDTNVGNMVESLTPPSEKLVAKGVESVRSRIALLKDYTHLSLEEIKAELRRMLCGEKTLRLGENDLQIIREIEQTYLDPEFFYGKGKHWSVVKKGRVEGCGELEIYMSLRGDKISSVDIGGDYFPVGDLKGEFLPALRGIRLDANALQSIMEKFPPEKYIRGLDPQSLINLILRQ